MPASPRRLALTAALCLLGGAAATVLVAWGFGLWGTVRAVYDSGLATLKEGRITPNESYPAGFASVNLSTCRWALDALPKSGVLAQARDQGPGIVDILVGVNDSSVLIHRTGWPLSALEFRAVARGTSVFSVTNRTGWNAPEWLSRQRYHSGPSGGRYSVPLRPIPLGFTLDTLFYAAILAALFLAPSRLRRSLRLRRGLCPACAYNLVGLTPGTACPECGHGILPAP